MDSRVSRQVGDPPGIETVTLKIYFWFGGWDYSIRGP